MSTSTENPRVSQILSTSNSSNATKRIYALTFSRDTKSAACSSVSPEISSTILLSFASPTPSGGALDDDCAPVARHLRANRTGVYERIEEDAEGTFTGTRAREKRDVANDLLQQDACLPERLLKGFVTLWSYVADHYYHANRPRRERRRSETGREVKT